MLSGVNVAIFSFSFWGLVAIYWKQISFIDPFELLGHRIIWGVATLCILFLFTRPVEALKDCVDSKKKILFLCGSSFLIFVNWFVFVWAISNGHVLEASLGYFINPLFNVALGVMVLKETLRPKQKGAVYLAVIGLLILISNGVGRPSISLALATTFGLYGLLRKQMKIPALEGLFFEMLICTIPISIILMNRFDSFNSFGFFEIGLSEKLYISLAGLVTLIPLVAFNYAVKKIQLSTIGILQYIAPILQFILAVFIYNESFSRVHILSFSFIWIALIIYTIDLISNNRKIEKV
jgi:chloramphenicol-sensitive protein RarD